MQKSKVFSKKLISLVLAALMAVSGFFGVASTAFAYQNGKYHDADSTISSNALSWVEATDDATLEALLDTLDALLEEMDWDALNATVAAIGIESKLPSQIRTTLGLSLTINLPKVAVKTTEVVQINLNADVSSVDGIIKLMFDLKGVISDLKGVGNLASTIGYNLDGILDGISFNTFGNYFYNTPGTSAGYRTSGGSWRDVNSARFVIRGFLQWLLTDNRSLINNLLNGSLSLVTDKNGDLIDVYEIIGNLVGIDHDSWAYEDSSNGFVYNILKAVLVKFVPYYAGTEDTHLKEEGSAWVYDNELYKVLNYYLEKLSFNITYPEYATYTADMELQSKTDANGDTMYVGGRFNDSSKRRYLVAKEAGKFDTATGKIDSNYATANGWDPNLVYSQEVGYEGNVLVAKYGSETFTVKASDTIYTIIWRALPVIWKTALEPTIDLLHVNYNGHDKDGHGTNFDNHYFYWVNENYKVNGDYYQWKRGANYMENYNDTIINAWAADVYADYGFSKAADFLAYVKKTVTYDKTRLAKNDRYNWRDIDASILFNEIRYSPLADHWGIQTGPLNLYFEQTGATAVKAFFNGLYANKNADGFQGSLMSQIDNALVTAMSDLFPNSDNIGKAVADAEGAYDSVDSTSMPALTTTDATAVADVVSTLVDDAAIVFKYAADATDANLLNPFYNSEFASAGADTVITESNIEQALIPLAISALKHWNLTASIHNADWDKVCDIESMAVVALTEYLKYVYPDRDYSDLYKLSDPMPITANPDISYVFIEASSGTTLLDHAIMPMAADALTFVLTAAGMPFFEQTSSTCSSSGAIIKPLDYTFKGKGDGLNNLFWQTLNATVCYFGADKKIAALANAPNAISYSNTIWQNANNAVNTLLPVLSQLLGSSTAGSLDLQDFLWNKIVGSVADIAGNHGFTTVLTQIGNLVSEGTANPLYKKTAFNAIIFDVAKPLINLLLGSRTSTEANIINVTESTANPLNTFLVKTNINASINNLLSNILQITNGTNATTTITNNAIHAACFILMATHVLPKLRDNTIGGVSATLADHVVSKDFTTRLAIRNESWGINDFYNDKTNNVLEPARYYASVKRVRIINTSNGNDVTSLFTISANQARDSAPVGTSSVSLNPEQMTRLKIAGNNTPEAIYRVEVTYDMSRTPLTSAASNASVSSDTYTYQNQKAVDFFSVTASTTGDKAWTDAFSGDYASSNAELVNVLTEKQTSGSLDVYGPKLIVAGSNAASCSRGYLVENRQQSYNSDGDSTGYTGTNAKLNYATVARNTKNYYTKSGAASTAANANAAWVAVNTEGYVLDASGNVTSTTAASLATSANGVGYIKDDKNNTTAVAVATSAIGNYLPGTPIAGVYLDTTQIFVEGRHEKNNTNGSQGNRIISKLSEAGLDTQYNVMTINTTVGSFSLTIATGNIDSNYSDLKSTASGLAAHYFTANVPKDAVNALIMPAMKKTLSSGVNLDNLDNALSVEAEVKELRDTAYENPTTELDEVVTNVIKYRRDRHNVNYELVANYEEAVKKAKAVEDLISVDPQYETKTVDGEEVVVPVYEEGSNERYQKCDYLSYSPCIVLTEGARVFNDVYMAEAKLRKTNVFALLEDEITHATSSVDEYSDLDGEFTNTYEAFDVPTITSDTLHDFPYTTKDEGEWEKVASYYVTLNSGDTQLRFGKAVENENSDYELMNLREDEETGEDVKAYTDASWTAYVDALGECLDLAYTDDGDASKTVHSCYTARSHLVIAENNLELYDENEEPEEPVDTDITITGKVVIATSLDGEDGEDGIVGIDIYTDVNAAPVGTTAADGTFSVTVPQGTTSLTFSNHQFENGAHAATTTGCTIDRTVTLSGNASVNYTGVIPIIVCDWNGDGSVSPADKGTFTKALNSTKTSANYNVYCNLNADTGVTPADKGIFTKFVGKVTKAYRYADKALD